MVYIILGKGFEETEAVAPGDVLRRAQIPMQYAGIGGRLVEGAHGITVQADITVEEYALKHDRYVSAICAAPTILGKRGWIDGRHAVCYPGMEGQMGKAIVIFSIYLCSWCVVSFN